MSNKSVSPERQIELLKILKERFEKNILRNNDIEWSEIQSILESNPYKLWSVEQMELSGGEPDIFRISSEIVFCDSSKESPAGRRSLCYDLQALEARKQNKPSGSVVAMAEDLGIEILTEAEYFELQQFSQFDTKTSSWVKTPAETRKLGGALFGDYRFGRVFIYHNGADSYYSARGFRGKLKLIDK
ncbi:MAG: DUF4256 domain-containing protein [Candidatus Kapabacteria bacterium]|nr:DUF4256 domain-containing protein [Ignavibacteriota bacterium]MCW5884221.1 DUF4256 domain-containing protein [Candidatus Kapabacteria bacterium]